MTRGRGFINAWRGLMLLAGILVAGSAQAACGVAVATSGDLGSQSPQALKAGAPPYVGIVGGFSCPTAPFVVLLNGNYLKATVASGSTLKLTSTTTTDTISYSLSATANGSAPLVPGTPFFYINGTVLNVLGLFGPGAVNVPIYVKPSAAQAVAPGIYTGSVSIKWDWYFCSLLGVLNACIGTEDSNSRTATINFRLEVAAKPATVTISSITTWDPVSATTAPKAIPQSRRRTALTVVNPDIVPLDLNTLRLALPTGAGTVLALDGDGTGAGTVVQTQQGSTASALTVTYVAPSNLSDDVEFSSDNGATWGYVPVAGNLASQGAVTHVRFSPKGSMAASSSLRISIPYLVK